MSYPVNLKVYIDGKDATYYLFGTSVITPTDLLNTWRDIPISTYLRKTPGIHTIEVIPESGAGRVDVRVEIR